MSDQTQNSDNIEPKNLEETLEEIVSEEETSQKSISNDDEIIRLKDSLARSQADYQNLLMRVDRDKADMVSYLSAKIVLPLLKEVDNLERAVKLKEWVEGDGFIDWVRTVLSGMQKYLESQGVKSFVSIGEEVNPDRHDVMTQAPGPEGKIVTEFEKGYLIGDRVLRHAKVVVWTWE
jgi:molecular chaperone GrpE